jgi:hypothetical protein
MHGGKPGCVAGQPAYQLRLTGRAAFTEEVHGCQSRRWYEILGAPGRRHGNLVNDIWPQALENRREALEENSFASEVRPEILEYMQYAIRVHGILRETSR